MVQFREIPFCRIDMERFRKHFEEELDRFLCAESFEEAYDALLDLDALMVKYQTMETVCEIRNTMDVTDVFYKEEARRFDQIRPEYEALENRLQGALLKTPYQEQIAHYTGKEFFDRARKKEQCFSPDILEEKRLENKLSARYSELTATLTGETEEGKVPLSSLNVQMESADRKTRARYHRIWEHAWAGAAQELDEIYDGLVKVITRMAKKLGFQSYTQMGYLSMCRTSYGREQVAAFREEVKKQLVPVVNKLSKEQKKRLGVEQLYHYDENFHFPDEQFQLPEDVIEAFRHIFGNMSKETAVYFDELVAGEYYDLKVRPGKINGAYSNLVGRYHMPFIFETYDGTSKAFSTFAHEAGHGFHSYLKRSEPFGFTEKCSEDLAEIHSMSMEFLIWPYLDTVMPKEQIGRYKYQQLKSALAFIAYGCAVDEFQEIVYDNPNLTPKERLEVWKKLEQEYLPFRNYENQSFLSEGRFWQKQTHIYKWPFYYIDYVLAQVCALQVHVRSEADQKEGLACYMEVLRSSGKYGFAETLRRAGLESPFEADAIRTLVQKVISKLDALKV